MGLGSQLDYSLSRMAASLWFTRAMERSQLVRPISKVKTQLVWHGDADRGLRTQEAEAGRSLVNLSQPGLQCELQGSQAKETLYMYSAVQHLLACTKS